MGTYYNPIIFLAVVSFSLIIIIIVIILHAYKDEHGMYIPIGLYSYSLPYLLFILVMFDVCFDMESCDFGLPVYITLMLTFMSYVLENVYIRLRDGLTLV